VEQHDRRSGKGRFVRDEQDARSDGRTLSHPPEYGMTNIAQQIDALDERLLSGIPAQMIDWDRRALLALHAAVATTHDAFAYLEIGSYQGGSLQVVVRDPRCVCVMSIDARTAVTPDATRGTYTYEDNTTSRMLELLGAVPEAELTKLATFEADTGAMSIADLPTRPNYCFIDGEHTDDAVLRDARFCAEALGHRGVIAFHDSQIIARGIRAFLREAWSDISHAIAFTGQVFALELGGAGVLRAPVVDRVIDSRWRSTAWRLASRPARSPLALLAAWAVVPRIEALVEPARRWHD